LNIQRFSNFTTDNTKAETDKEARNLKTKVIWLVLFTKYCYFISSGSTAAMPNKSSYVDNFIFLCIPKKKKLFVNEAKITLLKFTSNSFYLLF
jgi:hypothetical protein